MKNQSKIKKKRRGLVTTHQRQRDVRETAGSAPTSRGRASREGQRQGRTGRGSSQQTGARARGRLITTAPLPRCPPKLGRLGRAKRSSPPSFRVGSCRQSIIPHESNLSWIRGGFALNGLLSHGTRFPCSFLPRYWWRWEQCAVRGSEHDNVGAAHVDLYLSRFFVKNLHFLATINSVGLCFVRSSLKRTLKLPTIVQTVRSGRP